MSSALRRRGSGRLGDGRGSAVVEMAVLGSVVLALLSHAVATVGSLQRMTLATSLAAREGGRAALLTASVAEVEAALERSVAEVLEGHGIAPGAVNVSISGAFARGGWMTVKVTGTVPVARLPFGMGGATLSLPVEGRWTTRVDPYRSMAR